MYIVEVVEIVKEEKEIDESINPYANFLYALKSPEVRRQYPKLLKIFLDTIKFELDKVIEERLIFYFSNQFQIKKGLKIK